MKSRGIRPVRGAAGIAVVLLAVTVSVVPRPVAADGALVVGIPEGGLRKGFAYGRAIGGSEQEVIDRASKICRQQATTQGFEPSRCALIETFRQRCIAVAMDTVEKWAGWAVAADQASAETAALAKCREGAGRCRIHSFDCDE